MLTVSVIIPTYNRDWCLDQAIDSVLAQDYTDFELIVVDDGSDDETSRLLEAYPQVMTLVQDHQGVSAARNAGVLASQGRFVAFLDSDDTWKPSKLSEQVAFFDGHPEINICQTQEIWIRNGIRVNPRRKHQKPSGFLFEASLELCLVSPSAVMMRRSLFELMGGFDESLPACEDYDLWLRIGRHHPVALIDQALVVKRGGHADQLSASICLDAYRIRSLVNLLEKQTLTVGQREAVIKVLEKKCHIYSQGCRKRQRTIEANFYEELAQQYVGSPPVPSERRA